MTACPARCFRVTGLHCGDVCACYALSHARALLTIAVVLLFILLPLWLLWCCCWCSCLWPSRGCCRLLDCRVPLLARVYCMHKCVFVCVFVFVVWFCVGVSLQDVVRVSEKERGRTDKENKIGAIAWAPEESGRPTEKVHMRRSAQVETVQDQ
jgi:hypothetical protein